MRAVSVRDPRTDSIYSIYKVRTVVAQIYRRVFSAEPRTESVSGNRNATQRLSVRDTERLDEILAADFKPSPSLRRAAAEFEREIEEGKLKIR